MSKGFVLATRQEQFVILPTAVQFPVDVGRVDVRVVGNDRVISPAGSSWNSFFSLPADDFLELRADQSQSERDTW